MERSRSLEDHIAFVSGGGSGVGRASAMALAHEGAAVLIADIQAEGAEGTVTAILAAGGTAEFRLADVTDADQTKAAIDHLLVRHGRLDIAVNNAGIITPWRMTADISDDEWDRQIAINLSAVRFAMKVELAAMVAQQSGSIINIASGAGLKGLPGGAAYTAAKHGVIGLTKASSLEYARQGIRINAICPGYIDTPIHAPRASEGKSRDIGTLVPMGRAGRADEVADAVVWLASSRSSFVTGIALPVDGGYSAG